MSSERAGSEPRPGFYRALVENFPDVILVVGSDMTVRWASPSCEGIVGRAPKEIVGATIEEYVHPTDLGAVLSEAACEPEVVGRAVVRLRHNDGSWRRVEASVLNLLKDPNVRGFLVSGRDADGRARAGTLRPAADRAGRIAALEEGLGRGEQRYRAVVEQTTEGIYLVDAKTGVVIESNPALREMLGHAPDEDGLAGAHLHDIVAHPPEDIADNLRRTLREGRRFVGERRYRRKDGTVLDVEVGASTIQYEDEQVVCVMVRDITWRKEAKRQLRETEARYRALVEHIPVVTYTQEIEHNTLTYISPQFEGVTGYSVEEYLEGRELLRGSTIHPEDRERVIAEDERTDATGEPYSVEYRKIRKDGRAIWVRDEAVLVRDEEGRPLYWQGVLVDITRSKEAEEALKRGEERYRAIFEQAAVGMAQVGLDGRWLRVNEKVLEILGYERDELLTKTFQEMTHPDDLDRDVDNARRLRAGTIQTYSVEKRYIRKDGRRIWVNLTVSVARDSAGEPDYFISIIEDITGRRLGELVSGPLTTRELQTLRLMSRGMSNRQIGEALRHSMATAKLDVRRVLAKLGTTDREEAAIRAVEIGLLPPSGRW